MCDSGINFYGLKIWGSPWTRHFTGMNPHCMAFTVDEEQLREKWALIPEDTDILITHSPPHSILDKCRHGHVGSVSLFGQLKYRIRPKLHVFGHIHEGYGQIEVFPGYNNQMVKHINASHVNDVYDPVNPPITLEI